MGERKALVRCYNYSWYLTFRKIRERNSLGFFFSIFKLKFQVAYGMTETSPITFSSYAHDRLEIRSSTIGYPADHTEVNSNRLIDCQPSLDLVPSAGQSSQRRQRNRPCQHSWRTVHPRLLDHVEILEWQRKNGRNHHGRSLVAHWVSIKQNTNQLT